MKRKSSIFIKILIIFAPVFLGMLYFSYGTFVENQSIKEKSEQAIILANYSTRSSSLVHELQKERGMSAGFLGSKGKKFDDELPLQHATAQKKLDEYYDFISTNNIKSEFPALKEKIDSVEKQLGQISEIRQRVLSQDITVKEEVAYYTNVNKILLESIEQLQTFDFGSAFISQASAYSNFLQSKERAGVERAVLSNTFAADKFQPGFFVKFIELISEQKTFMNQFLKLANDQHRTQYLSMTEDKSFAYVEEKRALAKSKYIDGGFDTDSTEWFKTITVKINLLKNMEDQLNKDIIALAVTKAGIASDKYHFYLYLSLIFSGLSIGTFFYFTLNIVKSIKSVVNSLSNLASGDADLTTKLDVSSSDEVGELCYNFNSFLDKLREIVTEVNDNVHTLNSFSNELLATTQEIHHSMSNTTSKIHETSDVSSNVKDLSSKLSQNFDELNNLLTNVNDFGKSIQKIAKQTDLLALNATIEAASVGEAGRSFAVVANEVKNLSAETYKITDSINQQIDALSENSNIAKDSLNSVSKNAQSLDTISSSASEMIGQTETSVKDVTESANELLRMSSSLRSLVGQFKI